MNVAFGHTNMDLDCLGSLILVKKLFPDYQLVRSRLAHPGAQHLLSFYSKYFGFLDPKDLAGEHIEKIIIVDTCAAERVKEYFTHIANPSPKILIFDHHKSDACDIPGAVFEGGSYGAAATGLAQLAMKKKANLLPEEATIALAGIYADTGRFIYEQVRREDFEAAAWLLERGAVLQLVKSFLESITEDRQLDVLNRVAPALKTRIIQGHRVLLSFLELEEQISGLSEVTDKIMEMENPDAYFAVFYFPKNKSALVIGRSQKEEIDLSELTAAYGGGGRPEAASAKMPCTNGAAFMKRLLEVLERTLSPAPQARDIMTKNVYSIYETTSLMDASMFLERVNLTGVPVVNVDGKVSGFISLRDIMKGRKAGAMKAPVSAYMSKPVISAGSLVTLREIEQIFYKHHIGRLPIVEDDQLLGIVTRWDYLEYRRNRNL